MHSRISLDHGVVPRNYDRAKLYLYFKGWLMGRFLKFRGARDGDSVVRAVLLASMGNRYVEGTATLLNLCGQTIRNHLRYQDPSNFTAVNSEIVAKMKALGALSKPLTIAVDSHDEMYYGDPEAEGVIGTQPKKGSHHAYRYATASVLMDGERVTLAATPILRGCSILEHVKRLLCCVSALGVKVKLILFDRGYYSAELIRYLDSLEARYVMRIPVYTDVEGGEDRMYTTTGHRRRDEEQATFRLVAIKGKDKSGKGKLFVFATNASLEPGELRELFRRRWGIETSYRMIRMFLAKTTSRLHRLRTLYFYLAVTLYNLWVMINFLKGNGKGTRRIIADTLKLHITLPLTLPFIQEIGVINS